ncbi:MAG TPA: GAF domain-containing protein, partial [Terriglobales bacterium]|nr:GAF domain-containing protein [Terriglobales bacterium]
MATQPTDTAKPRVKAISDELTVIAQRAQAFTNASGTAIALSEGNVDEIICRARSGAAAPEVGATLRIEGSFTGLCIQTGKELRCDDAETDTRVDTVAIRALGIRSMVVTPIKEDNKVTGVLACFAPTAHAFTITHVAVLKTMADQITVLLQKERRAREEGRTPALEISVAKPAPSPAVVPAPVVIRPAGSAAAAPAPARSQFPQVAKVEPVAAPVPFPKKEEKRPEVRASFGTLDTVAGEGKGSDPKIKILGAVAVLLVAGLATFGVLKMRKPGTPPQHAQAAVNAADVPSTTAQVQQAQPAQSVASNAGSVAPTVVANSVPSSTSARSGAAASALDATRKPEKPAVKAAEEPQKPAPAPVATIALANGPSHILKTSSNGSGAELAPALNVGSNSGSGSLSALARPVSGAPSAALAQSDLEPMKVLKQTPPVYPAIAKVRRMSGQVVIEVTVG